MRIKKSSLLTIIFLSIVIINVKNVMANVEILSDTGYTDQSGFYNVVGEIQNTDDQTISLVEITASFYNSNNNTIAERTATTMLSSILVNRKSPFNIQLLDETLSENVDHYALNFQFSYSDSLQKGIEILSHKEELVDDILYITGNVTNIENTIANNVKIIVTFYDSSGNVIAAKRNNIDPIHNNLEPNQIREFEILLDERIEYVDHYQITAESLQYAEIPEFQMNAIVIIGILTLVTFIIFNRKKIISNNF